MPIEFDRENKAKSDSLKLRLPKQVEAILDRLQKNGYEAYIVGGCVRDSVLGRTPYDWDVTTNALPDKIKELFCDKTTVQTGIKHGTVSVISDGMTIEVTTYRIDGAYSDNRHPDSVCFTGNLKEDLSRRDFTVNAMAYSTSEGIIDLFGGLDDIKNKMIRCVGEADKRFNEDALRILRGLRFASTLNFSVDSKTSLSMHKNKNLILKISAERVSGEFVKLICGENAEEILRQYHDVISVFIPEASDMVGFEQNNPYHKYDVYEHTIKCIGFIEPIPTLRLAMFFHDIGKPYCYTEKDGAGHFYSHADISEKIAEDTLKRLKLDNKTIKTVCTLVKYHDIMLSPEEKRIRRLLNKFGEEILRLLLKVKRADNMAQSNLASDRIALLDNAQSTLNDIIRRDLCFSLKQLKINGNDLKQMGFEGKEIGDTLNILLEEVLKGTCRNTYEKLALRAKQLRDDM